MTPERVNEAEGPFVGLGLAPSPQHAIRHTQYASLTEAGRPGGRGPAAIRAMALDLARRYLVDFFEQIYFSWDQTAYTSPANQNFSRAAALITFASELKINEKELVALVLET